MPSNGFYKLMIMTKVCFHHDTSPSWRLGRVAKFFFGTDSIFIAKMSGDCGSGAELFSGSDGTFQLVDVNTTHGLLLLLDGR